MLCSNRKCTNAWKKIVILNCLHSSVGKMNHHLHILGLCSSVAVLSLMKALSTGLTCCLTFYELQGLHLTVEVVSSQWKAPPPPQKTLSQSSLMSLQCHCISLASALCPPAVSAHDSSFASFFLSAFLLPSATLPYSHRGLVWVINSWHSLGSTSQLQWHSGCTGDEFQCACYCFLTNCRMYENKLNT